MFVSQTFCTVTASFLGRPLFFFSLPLVVSQGTPVAAFFCACFTSPSRLASSQAASSWLRLSVANLEASLAMSVSPVLTASPNMYREVAIARAEDATRAPTPAERCP